MLVTQRGRYVTSVMATRAANIVSVWGSFLRQRMDKETCRNLKFDAPTECRRHGEPVDRACSNPKLELAGASRGSLVPREAPWTLRWIEKSASAIKRHEMCGDDRIRLVFSAGPQQLWRVHCQIVRRAAISKNPTRVASEHSVCPVPEAMERMPFGTSVVQRSHSILESSALAESASVVDWKYQGGWPSVELSSTTPSLEKEIADRPSLPPNEIRDYIASRTKRSCLTYAGTADANSGPEPKSSRLHD